MTTARSRYYDSPLLTLQECADLLGVNRSTIYRLLKRREIPGFQIGSDWRFEKKTLLKWIEDNTIVSGPRSAPGSGRPR